MPQLQQLFRFNCKISNYEWTLGVGGPPGYKLIRLPSRSTREPEEALEVAIGSFEVQAQAWSWRARRNHLPLRMWRSRWAEVSGHPLFCGSPQPA